MRILIKVIIFCILSNSLNAQITSGFAEYEIKLAEDNFAFNSKLYFNHQSSTFISKQSNEDVWRIRKNINQETMFEKIYSDTIGHTVLTTLGKSKIRVRDFCEPSKPRIYEDNISINWKLQNETKEIQGLSCNKATAKFRGRKYEAWYTKAVPIPFGPWKFHGLPGLIIELSDRKKEVIINLVNLRLSEVDEKVYYENGREEWVKMTEFYSCLDREFEKSMDAHRAFVTRTQAEYPTLEIEMDYLKKRPATELEFE